ncbi:MAG: DUF2079 domain-containing protein [Anaerolineales bacterium]|nr:MAG: DUF2079 domain-containing protein [Anaerolineales bacterium]
MKRRNERALTGEVALQCVSERQRGLARRQTLSLVLSLALVALNSGLVGLFLWDFHHPVRLITLLQGEKVYRYYLVLLARFVLAAEVVGMGLWIGSAYLRVRAHGMGWVPAVHQRALPFIPYLVLPLSMLRYRVHPLGVTYGSSIWFFLLVLVLSAGLAWLGGGIAQDLQALTTSAARPRRWFRGRYLVLLMAAVYFCTFAFLSVSQHDSFRTHAQDLGTMDQATWNTSRGRILEFTPLLSLPSGPSRPDNRLIGGKMELIFLPLAALYWLWADPRLLLILQTLFLAWGTIPLYEIARDRLKDGMAASLISAAYLAYLPLHYVNMHDFHAPVLMVPFLFYVFLFAMRQQWGRYYLFLLLAFLCRVDAALIALVLGVYLFACQNQRRHGLWTALFSLAWLALDFGLVAPLVESRYGPGTNDLIPQRFGSFGGGALSVGWGILSHPGAVMATLTDREKVQTLFDLLAPLGFLPLAGPGILIPALPVVLLNLLAESPWQGTIYAHYFAPVIPLLAVAAVYGLDNLTRWARERLRIFRLDTKESAAASYHLALFALTNALLVAYFVSPFPPGQYFHLANYRQVTAHERVLREIMETLPAGAKISAQSGLFPHLSHRPVIYLFPIVADAQYVLVDLDPAAEKSPIDWYSFMGRLGDLQRVGLYVPTHFRDGVLLLERSGGEVVPINLEGELQVYGDGLFRAEFLAHGAPNALRADQLYVVKVTVANRGTQSWVSKTTYFPVRLSYHWRDSEGKTVVWDGVRTDFPYPVRPGQTFTAGAILITPEQPGSYTLEWDLVQEEINWFAERGSFPLRVPVVVEGDAPSKSGASNGLEGALVLFHLCHLSHPAPVSLLAAKGRTDKGLH